MVRDPGGWAARRAVAAPPSAPGAPSMSSPALPTRRSRTFESKRLSPDWDDYWDDRRGLVTARFAFIYIAR